MSRTQDDVQPNIRCLHCKSLIIFPCHRCWPGICVRNNSAVSCRTRQETLRKMLPWNHIICCDGERGAGERAILQETSEPILSVNLTQTCICRIGSSSQITRWIQIIIPNHQVIFFYIWKITRLVPWSEFAPHPPHPAPQLVLRRLPPTPASRGRAPPGTLAARPPASPSAAPGAESDHTSWTTPKTSISKQLSLNRAYVSLFSYLPTLELSNSTSTNRQLVETPNRNPSHQQVQHLLLLRLLAPSPGWNLIHPHVHGPREQLQHLDQHRLQKREGHLCADVQNVAAEAWEKLNPGL